TGLAGEAGVRLTSVTSHKEPVKAPVSSIMMGGGFEAAPMGGAHESMPMGARSAVAAVSGQNLAYDEETLQVPTWIRRQAD
ncbi:MAG: hypothetical protein CO017_09160, partial [Zetaproteobacteria bacterium CG_4_8_14_3_um_filter_59_5]